jgi:hypothetical protein
MSDHTVSSGHSPIQVSANAGSNRPGLVRAAPNREPNRPASDALHVLTWYVAPVGLATFEVVAILARTNHIAAAWLTIGIVFLMGVAIARTGGRPASTGRHRSPAAWSVNHRAAIILPIAALVLASLLGLLAVLGGVR